MPTLWFQCILDPDVLSHGQYPSVCSLIGGGADIIVSLGQLSDSAL